MPPASDKQPNPYASCFKYCLKTWIQPWAEHFATTFIDQHRHFGLTTTSSAESMHANIKRHISGSTGDLRSATDGLVLFWKAQGARILAEETFVSGLTVWY
ncbi:hypothetical protein E4U56_001343 [Claviceps arundinis]|uniref:Uncharacterized protein n=1 Tax=Claviceps arundinis TaxID=1623583 RepID=A0A9P7MSL0_9HYPO|nr:hypothetical protein E4U56_001343 [Claviceps arundinis]